MRKTGSTLTAGIAAAAIMTLCPVTATARNGPEPSIIHATTQIAGRPVVVEINPPAAGTWGALLAAKDGVFTPALADHCEPVNAEYTVERALPRRLTSQIVDATNSLPAAVLTLHEIKSELAALEAHGLSGAVLLKIDGKIVHGEGYGFASPATNKKNEIETIFDVGSRPIDFTIASIFLLEQRGVIDLNDSISEYVENVPEDKKAITLGQLVTGRSGLQDFHDAPADWDPDLAWIDRETAVRRIMAQPLLFKPGSENRHSHSAFGLLASIVETESGTAYYDFVRVSFLNPAGMNRTGEYGSYDGHSAEDFATGGGPSLVGDPNIPPNWGKTSWLVNGSGGMYSTLTDLMKFYVYLRNSGVLDPYYVSHFENRAVNIDGTVRGFELFSSRDEKGADEVFLVVNMQGPNAIFGDISRALDAIILEH